MVRENKSGPRVQSMKGSGKTANNMVKVSLHMCLVNVTKERGKKVRDVEKELKNSGNLRHSKQRKRRRDSDTDCKFYL
jgi:hypothetical protein